MDIYLPIAEMAVNVFLILGLGGLVGFLSGLFGIGGGFLVTPLLIFIGIPPAVAAATGASQIVAPSVSAFLAHWRRGNVDLRMGSALLAGGVLGSAIGVAVFAFLHRLAQLDVVIKLAYVRVPGRDRSADAEGEPAGNSARQDPRGQAEAAADTGSMRCR